MDMNFYILAAVAVPIIIAIKVLPHTNTRIGQKLRESDRQAWRDAVEEKERELAELRKAEPR